MFRTILADENDSPVHFVQSFYRLGIVPQTLLVDQVGLLGVAQLLHLPGPALVELAALGPDALVSHELVTLHGLI